jgi:hypothetical protein
VRRQRPGLRLGLGGGGVDAGDLRNQLEIIEAIALTPPIVPWLVLDGYRAAAWRMPNIEVHVFPVIQHGFLMPSDTEAFDVTTRDFAIQRTFAILDRLRSAPVRH